MKKERFSRKWTQEEEQILKECYPNENYCLNELSKKLNRNKGAIKEHARLQGIKRRLPIDVNVNYFDHLDTWEKWYFVGLLWADGTNQTEIDTVRINLKEEDKELLEYFSNAVGSSRKIYFIKPRLSFGYKKPNKPQYEFRIKNKNISEKLESYGMVARKTMVLNFPNNLPFEFESAFILGYFDGDGWICDKEFGKQFGIVGTNDIILNIQNILIQRCNVSKNKIRQNSKNICSLSVTSKKDILSLKTWLYKDATIYLKRKYNKFHDITNV